MTRLNEYRYDEYSQLTKSIYYEHNGSTYTTNGKFNEDFTYHTNGRLNTVLKNGNALNNQSLYQIDNLSYIYAADNLRLTRVQDANSSNNNTQGHNQRSITGTAFTYDNCGNVTSDLHRAISSISYNHLNLPTVVLRSDNSKLEMTYDADGNLLCRKTFAAGGTIIETRDYIGGIELVNNDVNQINHSQGRLQKHLGAYRHEYVIKDHLGNTRVVYFNNGGTATIIDENHYYAYGMEYGGFAKTSGTTTYNYMFNGIERSESFNLDFAFYRGLDPVLGVWMQVDPKAEQVIGMYPYCAMGNNPISQMDPDGDLPFLAVVGIAFATGVATNGVSNLDNGENFWSNGFSAGLWSAASAAVTFGIGDVFGATGSLLKEFGRAGAHSLASGTFSHMQGGNFWHGAASGGISSLGGSAMQAGGFSDPAMITGSAALGGLGSKISGGDFWQGFAQGMAVGAFNHAMEHGFGGQPKPNKNRLKENIEIAKPLDQWVKDNQHKTKETLQNERSKRSGPKREDRYVIDPKTGNVIDMRHFLIIGQSGPLVGNSVEVIQSIQGYKDSAHNPQDYFSNDLGYKFYRNHTKIVYSPQGYAQGTTYDFGNNFVNSISNFLKNR